MGNPWIEHVQKTRKMIERRTGKKLEGFEGTQVAIREAKKTYTKKGSVGKKGKTAKKTHRRHRKSFY
jgi:hypothetical protein